MNTLSTHSQITFLSPQRAASDLAYACTTPSQPGFIAYNPAFTTLLGPAPKLSLLHHRDHKFAHEAGVYIPSTHAVYFTGNYAASDPVELYSINCTTGHIATLDNDTVKHRNANGACSYASRILYCCQGSHTLPSALIALDPLSNRTDVLLDNFHGRPFNSINDVVVHHPTHDIWFTDPTYGFEQNFTRAPCLPAQLYRFRPSTGEVWCVADGFVMCNGLCFSPDYSRLYVTDTGAVQAHGTPWDGRNLSFNPRLPASIYVYDVMEVETGEVVLGPRRMFAYCSSGIPDGIKCDAQGNVYSGCGDGVHVWNKGGTLLGKIFVGSVVANFNFSSEGIWMFAEERLFLCELEAKGALVDVECK